MYVPLSVQESLPKTRFYLNLSKWSLFLRSSAFSHSQASQAWRPRKHKFLSICLIYQHWQPHLDKRITLSTRRISRRHYILMWFSAWQYHSWLYVFVYGQKLAWFGSLGEKIVSHHLSCSAFLGIGNSDKLLGVCLLAFVKTFSTPKFLPKKK